MYNNRFLPSNISGDTNGKVLIILSIILLILSQTTAQSIITNSKTVNNHEKIILSIPAQINQGSQTMPLEYSTLTTRVETKIKMKMDRDTIPPSDSGHRWTTTYGASNHYEGVYDLLEDYDRGYYMVGYDVITGSNGKGWNIKTDINGNMLWDKKLVHPELTEGFAVCLDSIGNKYVTGVDFSDGSNRPFIVKFNPCGEKLWCSIFEDWGYEQGFSLDILINHKGNILVLSRLEDVDHQQINQVFLLCFSPEGNLLWTKPYASKNDYPLISLAVGSKLYHFGEDYIISGYCYYPYPEGDPNHVWLRPLFIGIDSLFNEKWIMPFAVNDSVLGEAYSAIPLNDSVIMGVGYSIMEQSGYYGRASTMMFFNHDGEELGFKVIQRDSIVPGTLGNTFMEIESINDSMFIATAVFGPSNTFNYFGEMIIDTSGKVYKAVSRPNTVGVLSLLRKTFDNKYIVACGVFEDEEEMDKTDITLYKLNSNLEQDTIYSQNFVYDSLCPYPIVSGDIDMTNCTLQVGIDETHSPEQYYENMDAVPIKAYPSPAESIINFDYKNTELYENISLSYYNTLGQTMYSEKIIRAQRSNILNVSSWNSGIYIAIVTSKGKVVGKVKFVVR